MNDLELNNIPKKPFHWLKRTSTILLIGIISCSIIIFVLLSFFQNIWFQGDSLDAFGQNGAYTLAEIVLTNELDQTNHPMRSVDKFRPYEKIIGWVSTKGAEGIIGMRWYYEDQLIFENFGKTQNNQIFTFLQSNAEVTLPEGEYRLDIHITEKPLESIPFVVEQYKPEITPSQPTPVGHKDVENSAFVDVPFAFDEVWIIGETEWLINEVKVTFLNEQVFVTVAVKTDIELEKLSDNQAFAFTKPIATYAIRNGYLDQARALQIDGQSYSLDQIIYVNLVNRISDDPLKQVGKPVYRTGFSIADLLGSQS